MNKTNLSDLIKRRNAAKDDYDEVSKEMKAAKKIVEGIEYEILSELNESGLDMVKVDNVTVTKNSQDLYNVTDWDLFYDYVHKNKAYYLLQKRLMQAGVGELVDNKHELPVEKFTKHKISIRKV